MYGVFVIASQFAIYFLFPKLPADTVNAVVGIVTFAVFPAGIVSSICPCVFTVPPVHPLNSYPALDGLFNVKLSVSTVYPVLFVIPVGKVPLFNSYAIV